MPFNTVSIIGDEITFLAFSAQRRMFAGPKGSCLPRRQNNDVVTTRTRLKHCNQAEIRHAVVGVVASLDKVMCAAVVLYPDANLNSLPLLLKLSLPAEFTEICDSESILKRI